MNSVLKNVPAYTFSKGKQKRLETDIPGPGNYELHNDADIKLNNYTRVVFNKAKKNNNINDNPGPGQYDNSLKNKIKGGIISMSKNINKNSNLPGPGEYTNNLNSISHIKRGIKISQSKRDYIKNDNDIGPGSYNPNYDKLKSNKGGFGSSLSKAGRNLINKNDTPGPGAYNNIETNNKKGIPFPKRGIHSTNINDRYNNNIGPGEYDFWNNNGIGKNSKGGVISKNKNYNNNKNYTPGPGDYYSDFNNQRRNPHTIIGKSKRNDLYGKKDIPGPGEYNYNYSTLNKKGNYRINSPRNKFNKENLPGPGDYYYDGNNIANNKKGIIIPKFKLKKSINDIPGPGDYDTNIYYDNNKYKFPLYKSTKINPINTTPGVGQYEIEKSYNFINKQKGFKIPKSKRDGFKTNHDVGPGNYNINRLIPEVPDYNYPSNDIRKIKKV